MSINWSGVIPALTTKFNSNDILDLHMFEKNLHAQIDAGVNGVIIGGSLGEASTLTTGEKEALVKLSVETCGGKIPVLLNIAEGSTGQTKPVFKTFLNYSLRSAIEVVNCLIIARRRDYITEIKFKPLYDDHEVLVKMITSLRNSLG